MNNNRFLFLEEELKMFSGQHPNALVKKKKQGFISKAKSKYSKQKVAPAVAAAVIGVGWKVIEFIAANSGGDIDAQLSKLEGEKFPNDDKPTYNTGIWRTKTKRVKGMIENGFGIDTSATIELRYKYNGHGVADIDMDLVASDDPPGFGLVVSTKLLPSRNNYTSNNGGQLMSMVEVTFNYKFSRTIGSDIHQIKRFKLFGDGTIENG
ncbi:hypothetical protein [uncultured Algibacter sp.]|uniref:hypothetical protein n=1 Tax=uncultured Algibacter sp. TaxID=298659 RepID=UPI0032177268